MGLASSEGLGLSDGCNGHLQARDASRELGALACWWIRRKPLEPFFVHAGEVVFLRKHNCDADKLV